MLSTLTRADPVPDGFPDRVLLDLERRGLVRRADVRATARWWAVAAAAVLIFAWGLGVGSTLGGPRPAPSPFPTPSSVAAGQAGAEVNVPRVGQSEVWF
jgi:hypothetical protein